MTNWEDFIEKEMKEEYFRSLSSFLTDEEKNHIIYPDSDKVFAAFDCTPYDEVKVVILGQDPYINKDQAMGLSFSVPEGTKLPPTLRNIYKELNSDLGIAIATSGDLTPWTKQGVMLLNSVLTVREGQSGSHQMRGWETFTDRAISFLAEKDEMAFVLWGAQARAKKELITNPRHLVIESVHPSPLSAHSGFFGSKPFSKINSYLTKPIDWHISK